jgi:hypothetical protein
MPRMQTFRHLISPHRLQRILLWTLTVLAWMDGAVFGALDVTWRHVSQRADLIWLPGLARVVGGLIVARAVHLARLRQPKRILYWRFGVDRRRPHFRRSVLGSKLRRALRHRDERAWIARLIQVLRNLDSYARQLVQRLRCGHTRLWRTWAPVALTTALVGSPAPAPACADSS